MEKISKVVPSSSKNNIDMSKERPVRSGVPSFGMPVALSASREMRALEEARQLKEKEASQAKSLEDSINSPNVDRQREIVDRVSINFSPKSEKLNQVENVPLTLGQENSINNVDELDLSDSDEKKSLSIYA